MKKITAIVFLFFVCSIAFSQTNPIPQKNGIKIPKPKKERVLKEVPNIPRTEVSLPNTPNKEETTTEIFNVNGDEIWLFEHINYEGKRRKLKLQKLKFYSLSEIGQFWNDKFSSFKMPKGYVIIFQKDDDQNGGSTISFTSYNKENGFSCADLSKIDRKDTFTVTYDIIDDVIDFNDTISSIFVGN